MNVLYIHLEFAKWQQYKNTNSNSQKRNKQKNKNKNKANSFWAMDQELVDATAYAARGRCV